MPCDEPPPTLARVSYAFLGPDCQAPEPWGTITLTACVNGFWQYSTYQGYHCLGGTIVIASPPLATTTTTTPCTNAPPVLSSGLQTPCADGQLLSRNVYSLCETDGFWHVVEDDTYQCPGDSTNTTFRVFDAPTGQPCTQPAQT
jgi:hypothetical protein